MVVPKSEALERVSVGDGRGTMHRWCHQLCGAPHGLIEPQERHLVVRAGSPHECPQRLANTSAHSDL